MLSNPRRNFCERIVTSLTGVRAYALPYPRCSLKMALRNASCLRAKPHLQDEIARLRAQEDAITGLTVPNLVEKRRWLGRDVRANLAPLDPRIDGHLLVKIDANIGLLGIYESPINFGRQCHPQLPRPPQTRKPRKTPKPAPEIPLGGTGSPASDPFTKSPNHPSQKIFLLRPSSFDLRPQSLLKCWSFPESAPNYCQSGIGPTRDCTHSPVTDHHSQSASASGRGRVSCGCARPVPPG
jgi:hypothetical protein